MSVVVTVLHVIVCVFLIAVVLLQRGKGAQMGAVFGGGGGATMFGGRGAGNFLTKLTTGAAVVFMVTSLSLAYMGMHQRRAAVRGRSDRGGGRAGRAARAVRGDRRRRQAPAPEAAPLRRPSPRPRRPRPETCVRAARLRWIRAMRSVCCAPREFAAVAELVDAPA